MNRIQTITAKLDNLESNLFCFINNVELLKNNKQLDCLPMDILVNLKEKIIEQYSESSVLVEVITFFGSEATKDISTLVKRLHVIEHHLTESFGKFDT